MSQTQVVQVQSPYTPIKDAMQRHESGVTKNRRTPLTGSGRAWREDEEAYLLQTRMQKMPYKHIAARLNKTELACRLHYHQLSHGSARRRRAGSCSSGSSDPSPGRTAASPSPIFRGDTRSLSPAGVGGHYLPRPAHADVYRSRNSSVERSPRLLPAILPKPEGMPLSARAREGLSRYSAVTPEQRYLTLPPPISRHPVSPALIRSPASPLRLDLSRPCSPAASVHSPAHVDMARLRAVYEGHKKAFWTAVANDYGMSTSPAALEQAWRSGACCQPPNSNPMTPVSSPDKDRRLGFRTSTYDKTRISSILDD